MDKQQANFSLAPEVLESFRSIVPNGERSETVEELLAEYIEHTQIHDLEKALTEHGEKRDEWLKLGDELDQSEKQIYERLNEQIYPLLVRWKKDKISTGIGSDFETLSEFEQEILLNISEPEEADVSLTVQKWMETTREKLNEVFNPEEGQG